MIVARKRSVDKVSNQLSHAVPKEISHKSSQGFLKSVMGLIVNAGRIVRMEKKVIYLQPNERLYCRLKIS